MYRPARRGMHKPHPSVLVLSSTRLHCYDLKVIEDTSGEDGEVSGVCLPELACEPACAPSVRAVRAA